MVQWLRLCTFNAEDSSLTPGQGTKIPRAVRHSQNKKQKKKTTQNPPNQIRLQFQDLCGTTKNQIARTSLVVQWLRICLPQGTWVWSLVQEDSTC